MFKKELLFHFAFKRITNLPCIEVKPQIGVVPVHHKIDPKSIELEEWFSRDVSTVGHYATGDLELTLGGHADLKKAKGLICWSYELFWQRDGCPIRLESNPISPHNTPPQQFK